MRSIIAFFCLIFTCSVIPESTRAQTFVDSADSGFVRAEINDGGDPFKEFFWRVKADVNYVFEVVSHGPDTMDPMIILTNNDGIIDVDLDSGRGVNSILLYKSPSDAVIKIRVWDEAKFVAMNAAGVEAIADSDFKANNNAAFDLIITSFVEDYDTSPSTLSFDESAGFSLPAGGVKEFIIEPESEGELVLDFSSGSVGVDPMLELYRAKSNQVVGSPIATDDDGGEGRNSLLRYNTTERDKQLIVRARSFWPWPGSYSLTATFSQTEQGARVDLDTPREFLAPGAQRGVADLRESNFAEFRLSDAALSALAGYSGSLEFRLNAKHVEGSSRLADPVLSVGVASPFGYSEIASNDDFDGSYNSRIRLKLESSNNSPLPLSELLIRAAVIGSEGGQVELIARKSSDGGELDSALERALGQ